MLSNGHKVASSGGVLAVLCFFLPWILASCSGQPIVSLSGWELAAGTIVDMGMGPQKLAGEPILFLVLLAGFGVFALAYLAGRREYLTKLDGFGLIGLGVLPLLVLFSEFSGAQREAAQQGITIDYQYGLWGVILGYIAVIAGGVLNLGKQSEQSNYPSN